MKNRYECITNIWNMQENDRKFTVWSECGQKKRDPDRNLVPL
jgi:hypothetical protein